MPSPIDDDGDDEDEDDDDEPQPTPTTAELLRGEGLPARQASTRVFTLGVLPQNVRAVQIFQKCKPTLVAGLGASAWLGISSLELAARMDLDDIPKSARRDVAARVDVMDRVSTAIRNAPKQKSHDAPTAPTTAPPARK